MGQFNFGLGKKKQKQKKTQKTTQNKITNLTKIIIIVAKELICIKTHRTYTTILIKHKAIKQNIN